MEHIITRLRYCADYFRTESAESVLEQWRDYPTHVVCEEFLVASIFVFSCSALLGGSLEEKTTSIIGLEQCLSLAASCLDDSASQRLQSSILEKTLQRFDYTGDELAARSTQIVLYPGQSVAATTEALRAVLAILLRCVGESSISAKELVDLTRFDVALAVALIAEGLGAPKPAGLHHWYTQMALMLQQLTTADVFVLMMQRGAERTSTDASTGFGGMPIEELQARQCLHNQVVALSFVQFEVLDRVLTAAEDVGTRHLILATLVRTIHNLVRGRHNENSGRLLSRLIMLEFMRFGFRFLAPFARKLIETSGEIEAGRLFRHTCRTLSWLLVHAEVDGNTFLADSVKPLSSEWVARGANVGMPLECLSACIVLAANCGALEGTTGAQLLPFLASYSDQVEFEARRCVALTSVGHSGLLAAGLSLPPFGASIDEELRGDEDFESSVHSSLYFPGAAEDGSSSLTSEGRLCVECHEQTLEGAYGEGYFDGLWYCERCWTHWSTAYPDKVFLGPWPSECSHLEAEEQKGAGLLLLQAPGTLRCGISGRLLTSDPVHVPNSNLAAYPVAFERKALEKWCRRSGGTCPVTAQPMDLRTATPAPDGLEAVSAWLREQRITVGKLGP